MNNLLSLTYRDRKGTGWKRLEVRFLCIQIYKFHLVTTFYVITKQKAVPEKSEMTKRIYLCVSSWWHKELFQVILKHCNLTVFFRGT